MLNRRRFDTDPAGPFRVLNEKDMEVGIFPSYGAAVAMMLHGDRLQSMPQEEYDREMTDYHADLVRRGFIPRC